MIDMISSSSNRKIKLVRTLQGRSRQRKEEGCFVAEGVRLLEEAYQSNWPFEFILFDSSLSDRGQRLLTSLTTETKIKAFEIPIDLMAEISDTETPQGILAVLKRGALPPPQKPTFVIVADGIRDPGNMGTLLRTADATGAEAVFLSPGTVDAYSPKVVRAGMGAHFRLPILHLSWQALETTLVDIAVFAAEAAEGIPLWQADLTQACGLLIGGEAFGASTRGQTLASHKIRIPMPGNTESLNAAIAAGILMAEVLRQRYTED